MLSSFALRSLTKYLILLLSYMKLQTKPERPFVRIFSQKNKQKFTVYSNVNEVFSDSDANAAYNKFITIVQSAFEHSFHGRI